MPSQKWDNETLGIRGAKHHYKLTVPFGRGPFQVNATVDIDVPMRIWQALNSEDLDQVEAAALADAEKFWERGNVSLLPLSAMRDAFLKHLMRMVPEALYRRFVDYQYRRGNDAWAVPEQLQPGTLMPSGGEA